MTASDIYKKVFSSGFNPSIGFEIPTFRFAGDAMGVNAKDIVTLPEKPTTQDSTQLTPYYPSIEYFKDLQKELAPGLLQSEIKSNLLNLAGAGAYGLMATPFQEAVRDKELARQKEAFYAKEYGPTQKALRDKLLQDQFSQAADPTVAIMDALSRTRQAAARKYS